MKKIIMILLAVAFVSLPAEAQFFKKLFKKKAKTEANVSVKDDAIDDDAQVALADISSFSNNRNNRNAFLRIPLGIKANRFEKMLLQQGFVERKNDGKQTSKTYFYEGEVYGAKSLITLAVSDQTGRVYAVDVEDQTVYPSLQEVQQRFAVLKNELVKEAAVLLPYVSRWRGDFHFVANLLGALMNCRVEMSMGRYSHLDTTICWLPRVRYDLLIPGLSPETYQEKMEELAPLVDFIKEWLIPFDVWCEVKIKEHHPIPDKARVTLDYNTEVNSNVR